MRQPPTSINATLKVVLKPWSAPNFAIRRDDAGTVEGSDHASGIPVRELDDATLDQMAKAWLDDLYARAGRTYHPFSASRVSGEDR